MHVHGNLGRVGSVRILVTGACGFVGATLLGSLREKYDCKQLQLTGCDNLSRRGSEYNLARLQKWDVDFVHTDVRSSTDLDGLPQCDWVIDAAANASVLAGTGSFGSSRSIVENNLLGTCNLLELCKRWTAGLILLSTSRVYSLPELCNLPLRIVDHRFMLASEQELPNGLSTNGVSEAFSTRPPISLYGATKLASEQMALEYGAAFGFPVWINRCGVMAGAGQFGRADQGIFAFWLHRWQANRPLKYIGFDGQGHQVRDCLHPKDLAHLIDQQVQRPTSSAPPIVHVSGGIQSSISLNQVSQWCGERWGNRTVASDMTPRQYDVPWLVLDNSLARQHWGWQPTMGVNAILDEIALFAEKHPDWLDIC